MEKTRTWAVKDQFTEEEPSPFFTYEKQMGAQAIMIDFEFVSGNRLALPYSYMTRMHYDLSKGIILEWGDSNIQVEGRNLESLYKHLLTHRVSYIRESISEAERLEMGEYALFIEKLVFEDV